MRWRFKGFNWGITTRLVVIPHAVISFDLVVISQWLKVIPQWLVVISQQGKFKAPQPINKQCVNTQVNICEHQLGTMNCFVVYVASKAEIQASYITLHLWDIIVINTLPRHRVNNNDILLVV